MIIFLNLKNQITDGQNDFAFFDTIIGEILIFDGMQIFDSIEEFEEAHKKQYFLDKGEFYPLDRFIPLIPNNYFK